jgi:predicted permease
MQEQVTLRPTLLGSHGLYWLHFIARQSPATSIVQAQAWVDLQLHQYMTDRESAGLTPDRRQEIQKIYVELLPAGTGLSDLRQNYQQPLSVLMGVVVLVLLIACANLANFLLARTSSREREISTRLALGAGRWRVIRQILTETLLLSLLGGALGLFLAFWGTRALLLFMVSGATHTPFSPYPDWRVLLFTFTVSLFTGLLFGIAPALRISRMSLAPSLKSTSRSVAGEGSRFAQLLPKILVAAQVALSLVLLMGAGLFARTLRNLEHADYGFQRQNLLLTEINPANAGYKPEQLDAFYGRVVDRLGALPGVRSVTLSGAPPISKGSWNSPVYPSGHVPEPHEDNSSLINRILPRYFETVGIPLLAGRSIDNHDATGAAHVVVVNQSFANHFFPKSEAIGQRVSFAEPDVKGDWEIVGIVRDSKYNNPRETPQRMIYLPVLQLTQGGRYAYSLEVLTVGDPAPLAEGVRQTLARINPDLPVGKIRTIGQHMELFIDRETLVSELSIFFSLLALLLSSIGLYGITTYNVVRRTSEIGIRMALGAQGGSVRWMVLKESLRLLAIGIAIGIPAALGATRLIRAVLFGLSASDPLTLVGAILIISVLTLLAAYLPARRAMLVDPIISLRYD